MVDFVSDISTRVQLGNIEIGVIEGAEKEAEWSLPSFETSEMLSTPTEHSSRVTGREKKT